MLDVYLAVCKPSNTIERGCMTKEKIERKIAVIFATDVVGYSKHMEADESETIHNLRACEAILTGLFEKHDGRLFNTGGDSFLAEFPSAVSAVECAVEFQNAIKERNSSEETSVKLEFRIGINSGDVVKEKDNLLGDGVNIAARLEALAQTNGITISKVIYDFIKGKTKYEFNNLGVQKVKQNEFHAYDLLLETSQKRKIKNDRPVSRFLMATVFAFLIALGGLAYNYLAGDKKGSGVTSGFSEDKMAVLIMPFENSSGSKDFDYVANGLNTHISTVLSKIDQLFVFEKSSAEYFQKNKVNYSEMNKEHNVRFVLEGSVQVAGAKTRVNVSLRDLLKNEVIFSDVLDYKDSDIFSVQDRLSDSILVHLIPGVLSLTVDDALTKEKFSPEVHINRLKGRVAFDTFSVEGKLEYDRLLELNRELEPDNFYLDMDEAWSYMLNVWLGLSENPEDDLNTAYQLTLKVLDSDQDFAYAVNLAAMLERDLGYFESSCGRLEAIEKVSRDASNLGMGVATASFCGAFDKAISFYESVFAMAPHYPGANTKRAYAWSLVQKASSDSPNNFTVAKDFIKSQVAMKYDSKRMHESFLVLLAYVEDKEGNKPSASKHISEQNGLKNAITKKDIINDRISAPNNASFRQEFIQTLIALGLHEN